MAELAAGAVSSLLVVIRNEAVLLRGVHDDVQFIKEEMESMNSFLLHLARTEPPGSEHDEQVRTWMSQVRLLAQDCNHCIGLYLYRGNADIHRATAGLRRYFWWASWRLHKLVAQHNAAMELRQLKERARDVGERRMRYGVEVPGKSTGGRSAPVALAAGGYAAAADDEEDTDDHTAAAAGRRRAFFEPPTLEDYVKTKLLDWVHGIKAGADQVWSLAIVAPNAGLDVLALAHETLVVPMLPPTYCNPGYHRGITVDIPALHHYYLPLGPKEILYYILRELQREHDKDQVQEQEEEGSKDYFGFLQELWSKDGIRFEKDIVLSKINERAKMDEICVKLDRIKSDVKARQNKDNEKQLPLNQMGLDVHFQLLLKSVAPSSQQDRVKNKDMHKLPLPAWNDKSIMIIAEKLKQYIEAAEDAKVPVEVIEEAGERGGQDTEEEGKQGGEDGTRRDSCKDKDDMEEHNENEKEKVSGERKKENDDKEEEEKGGDGARGESKESEENEKQKKELQNEKKDEQEGGEGRKKNKQEQEEERDKEEEETFILFPSFEEDNGEEECPIHLHVDQYAHIIREVFEKPINNKPLQAQQQVRFEAKKATETTTTVLSEERVKQIIHETIQETLKELQEGKLEKNKALSEPTGTAIGTEVFEKTINNKPLQAQQQDRFEAKKAKERTTTVFSEERVKQIIHETNQEILKELQEGKLDKNKAPSESTDTATDVPSQNQKDDPELEQKFGEMKLKLKEQLEIKGLVDKIKDHLKDECPLIILKVDWMMDRSIWEDTRKALSLLKCSADALIFTTIKDIQRAKGYCCPPREPIDYSLVGLYHHTVLDTFLKKHIMLEPTNKNEDNIPKLFRDILEQCDPHEFCMKIFTHAVHANPKRSTEELKRLRKSLQDSPKSFDIIAKKLFKYSYNDLPKEYKSCLLYLAIFPQEQSLRRSTLVGRWVAEGLIFKEDWHGSVLEANRCFDTLINRWLIYPDDVGATGKVKSCLVGHLVHGFITAIARKQHIVETRLSHRFARHFSIFNDLRLRNTDKIDTFLKMLSESSQLSLLKLKVLDLEGCRYFDRCKRNERYLKGICSKMLLLKYLSLRRTGISHLPSEINNLCELEVLDIRETMVPANATVNVLLLKLKRLLAGNSDLSPSNSAIISSVQIPHRIGKMENMEVLSNVEARCEQDFKEIGKLCHLRKLGLVFEDKDIEHLLGLIKDLHECLCSLSITLSKDRCKGTPSSGVLPPLQPPKYLENLCISGTTKRAHLLLPLFDGNNTLTKVTLFSTPLNQNHMKILAKVPNLRCVRLRDIAYTNDDHTLTFKKGGFKHLKYLLIEASNLTKITFKSKAAKELEMMVLSSTMIVSVSGAAKLPKLEELELNNHRSSISLLSSFGKAKKIAKLTLRDTMLEQGDLQMLAKKPNLQCLLLGTDCCANENKITFNKDEFIKLNLLDVHRSAITQVVFREGSAQKLQKIIWSSSTSLSGIHNLTGLKELESHGGPISNKMKNDIDKHPNIPRHKHIEPEIQDEARGQDEDHDGPTRFPFCWKKRD